VSFLRGSSGKGFLTKEDAMKLPAGALRIYVSVMRGFGALAMGAVLLAGPAAQAQEHVRLMPQTGHAILPFVPRSPDGRYVLTA
jgi:hypothetical protein